MNGESSQETEVLSGVPQGTVIGPLHQATKFRVGSGVDLKCYFLYEIEAADHEYDLHISVITNPREIIAF